MKLKTYNVENASRTSSGKPMISFAAKGGVIRLNKHVVEALKIKAGDKYSIAQDENNVKEWYLYKDEKAGFTIRVNDKSEAGFNSSVICEDVRACVKSIDETKGVKMILVTEPVTIEKVKYFPILTSSAK